MSAAPAVSLRQARADDAAALAAFAERSFRDTFAAFNRAEDMDAFCAATYAASIQREEILDPDRRTLLAVADDTLVGYLQLHLRAPRREFGAGTAAELQRLYVDAAWQGRGVAVTLLDAAVALARAAGHAWLWLGVWEHNPRAQAFYARHGFTPFGEHVFVLGSDRQRDLLWVRKLDGATAA